MPNRKVEDVYKWFKKLMGSGAAAEAGDKARGRHKRIEKIAEELGDKSKKISAKDALKGYRRIK